MDEDLSEQSTWANVRRNIIELIQFIAIVLAVLLIIRFAIAEPHKVSGHSMVPNFQDGDYIITNKAVMYFSSPQRGEVVILQNPRNRDQVFIKRVIGLPGERIKLQDGKVYINGRILSEPYLPAGVETNGEAYLADGEQITLPAEFYFVMGDNRPDSSDSRDWGPVDKSLIVGQAWIRYWPPNAMSVIQVDTPSLETVNQSN